MSEEQKKKRGGKRENSGRPKKEKTKVVAFRLKEGNAEQFREEAKKIVQRLKL
jgi:hypothetical protein